MNVLLKDMASRIRELREISGKSPAEMARLTGVEERDYLDIEAGTMDPPFTFLHKCSLAFGVDINTLLEGRTAKLSNFVVSRGGNGPITVQEQGILIRNMAAMFKGRLATPYFVTYDYDERQQGRAIHTTTHAGQEFDYVVSGSMRIKVGDNEEILNTGDSIFYNSSTPHGMIAVGGEKCTFIAMVMAGDQEAQSLPMVRMSRRKPNEPLIAEKFVKCEEDEDGRLKHVKFENENDFNFAFDIVDAIAKKDPNRLAMLHISAHMRERRFTFRDMMEQSNRVANYLVSLGVGKGDKVMLILKRHYQFWPTILACHKIGAVAIPATSQLKVHDLTYRFKAGDVKALFCTGDDNIAEQVDEAEKEIGVKLTKIIVYGKREGWHDYNAEVPGFSDVFERSADSPCGNEPMLMFFTSGTTGYPKMALHSHKYALGHFVTAKYWHLVERDGLHFTISETGWGKALWGKLYGQWLCEGAVFTYDFERFDAENVLPMFAKYNITTFCAPPTIYRMLIKQDISKYDFSSLRHATTAGEALNPEVFTQFQRATGLRIAEGFGQTETTLALANLVGDALQPGSMGRAVPDYGIELVDADGNCVPAGENGEIIVRTPRNSPHPGIFLGYYKDEEKTNEAWRGGIYHTGDLAWRDENGYFHYVGRADDVIKSSGYRIGPAEIENVIMELPYVLECGVSAAPDPVRGQVVKASIVLVAGVQGTDVLKEEIQRYVKDHTAPYKYPRIVEFRKDLPKTISGKIQRNQL
jgi:acetyl-CoA synthetase